VRVQQLDSYGRVMVHLR